jgi:hypothetical protein
MAACFLQQFSGMSEVATDAGARSPFQRCKSVADFAASYLLHRFEVERNRTVVTASRS